MDTLSRVSQTLKDKDKDKDKVKDKVEEGVQGETGGKRVSRKAPLPDEPVAYWIQCTKPTDKSWAAVCREDPDDGWLCPIPQRKADQWAEAYPEVDVPRTLTEIRQRIRDTGKYRKTPQGAWGMVGNWLMNEQNRGGPR